MKFTEDLLRETQKTIKKDYGVEVTLDEADEILDNLTKYFKELMEIDHRQKSDRGNDVQ